MGPATAQGEQVAAIIELQLSPVIHVIEGTQGIFCLAWEQEEGFAARTPANLGSGGSEASGCKHCVSPKATWQERPPQLLPAGLQPTLPRFIHSVTLLAQLPALTPPQPQQGSVHLSASEGIRWLITSGQQRSKR